MASKTMSMRTITKELWRGAMLTQRKEMSDPNIFWRSSMRKAIADFLRIGKKRIFGIQPVCLKTIP
jgi:hypothetical protein